MCLTRHNNLFNKYLTVPGTVVTPGSTAEDDKRCSLPFTGREESSKYRASYVLSTVEKNKTS